MSFRAAGSVHESVWLSAMQMVQVAAPMWSWVLWVSQAPCSMQVSRPGLGFPHVKHALAPTWPARELQSLSAVASALAAVAFAAFRLRKCFMNSGVRPPPPSAPLGAWGLRRFRWFGVGWRGRGSWGGVAGPDAPAGVGSLAGGSGAGSLSGGSRGGGWVVGL